MPLEHQVLNPLIVDNLPQSSHEAVEHNLVVMALELELFLTSTEQSLSWEQLEGTLAETGHIRVLQHRDLGRALVHDVDGVRCTDLQGRPVLPDFRLDEQRL